MYMNVAVNRIQTLTIEVHGDAFIYMQTNGRDREYQTINLL